MGSINTIEGREELARIVRQARGNRKVREFAREVGISHAAISKLEHGLTKDPADGTLLAIAPFTEFSFEELKSILASRVGTETRHYRTAQELWPLVRGLPPSEKARLGQMILGEFGGLSPDP
jgi:transcriptional regulator with XRE-family HTH domain